MFNFSPFQSSKFRLPSLKRTAFFFDFDGALVPLETVRKLQPPFFEQHCTLLRRLRGLCGEALAIVSRFPVNYVEDYLPDIAYAVAGENGDAISHAPGAAVEKVNVPVIPPMLMSHIRKSIAHMHGVFLEHIEGGLLLRYIAAPEHAEELYQLAKGWINETKGKFRLEARNMAWVIYPAEVDKGYGIMKIMEKPPFHGRVPVFVGKNGTNEDALATVAKMQGVGLRIPTDFPTFATFWNWLGAVVESHE